MPTFDDKTNRRYGKLTVLSLSQEKYKKELQWLCKCDCGNITTVTAGRLQSGNTTSCGCRRVEALTERNTLHGKSKTKEYQAWKDMKKRCYNKNNKRYENYSSKGIIVCDEWLDDFEAFLDYIGKAPDNGQCWTIGRIDNNDSYKPGNVRWELLEKQARNHSLQKNNTSGINGIQLRSKIIAGKEYTAWVATWNNANGKKCTKDFSTNKYGFHKAKELAIQYRNRMLEMLQQEGIFYEDSHGTRIGE